MLDKIFSLTLNRRQFIKALAGTAVLMLADLFGVSHKIQASDKPLGEAEAGLRSYVCTVCGYIYDPSVGDPGSEIPPGTPFEKLPEFWLCPLCGAPKSAFNVW